MNFMERVQAPPWKGAIKFIQKLFICVLSREIEEIFIYQLFIDFFNLKLLTRNLNAQNRYNNQNLKRKIATNNKE